jgi:glycerate-2-kinase
VLRVQGSAHEVKGRIFVIGGGKASGLMAEALEKVIPIERIHSGLVNSQVKVKTDKIFVNVAGFPLPDNSGLEGVRNMLTMTVGQNLTENDTVIVLISGGGSALLPYPVDGVSLDDKKKVNEILFKCGADHYEINIVRKHLSATKGGKLARLLGPASVISLILSDDFQGKGDVASGPTSIDESTFQDAYKIVEKYGVVNEMPVSVVEYLKKGINGEVAGNVPRTDPVWKKVWNYTLADNKSSLNAMEKKALDLGFKAIVVDEVFHGNVNDFAKKISDLFEKFYEKESQPLAILLSSETHIIMKRKGEGGRNQHIAASVIKSLSGKKNTVFASADSDGVDFIRGVAGAIIDDKTGDLAKKEDIEDYIIKNNTFFLHEKLGTLIYSEPTGTNVGDLSVYLQEK